MALGSPGHWNKVSTGTVSTASAPSLVRTSDGVLHVVYSKSVLDGLRIGHTEINAAGTVVARNDVLGSGWYALDPSPVAVSPDGTALGVLFAGEQTQTSGYWSNGRIYHATSPSGDAWALPQESVGKDGNAISSHGTAATTLEDGTPVAGFTLNDMLTWHVGTDSKPDQHYQVTPNTNCCMFDTAMARTGSTVIAGWYQNGWNADSSGTFVKQIYPSVGGTLKAPGSTAAPRTGRVAMVDRRRWGRLRGLLRRDAELRLRRGAGVEGRHQRGGLRAAQPGRDVASPCPPLRRGASGSPGPTQPTRCTPYAPTRPGW